MAVLCPVINKAAAMLKYRPCMRQNLRKNIKKGKQKVPTIKYKNKDGKSYYSLLEKSNYGYFLSLVRSGMDPETAYKTTVKTIGKNRHKGKLPTIKMSNGELFFNVAKRLKFNFTDCQVFRAWNKRLGNPEAALKKALANIKRRKKNWEKYRNEKNNKAGKDTD